MIKIGSGCGHRPDDAASTKSRSGDAITFSGMMMGATAESSAATSARKGTAQGNVALSITEPAMEQARHLRNDVDSLVRHLNKSTSVNGPTFDYAGGQLQTVMDVMRSILDDMQGGLSVQARGGSDTSMVSLFGQLESLLNLVRVVSSLMQLLRGNAHGDAEEDMAMEDETHQNSIPSALARMNVLAKILEDMGESIQFLHSLSRSATPEQIAAAGH